MAAGFYDYFKENMEALGLPAPQSLYGTVNSALGSVVTLNAILDKFGPRVTIADLAGAGIRSEKLMVYGALSASYYVGAVIGSIAVATGRTLSGGTSLADVLATADQARIRRPWLAGVLRKYPGIYKQDYACRRLTTSRAY